MANPQNPPQPESQSQREDYSNYWQTDFSTKLRDLEERQRLIKDRVLLIGENVLEAKEKTDSDILELKKDVESIKYEILRIKDFLKRTAEELDEFAKKDELAILSKQAKMFQPLNLVTKDEIEEIIDKRIKEKNK